MTSRRQRWWFWQESLQGAIQPESVQRVIAVTPTDTPLKAVATIADKVIVVDTAHINAVKKLCNQTSTQVRTIITEAVRAPTLHVVLHHQSSIKVNSVSNTINSVPQPAGYHPVAQWWRWLTIQGHCSNAVTEVVSSPPLYDYLVLDRPGKSKTWAADCLKNPAVSQNKRNWQA